MSSPEALAPALALHRDSLVRRHPANPILTHDNLAYTANTVFNPGAVRLANGETLLLLRVEDRRGISHLTAARSWDGIGNWAVDPEPTLRPEMAWEEWGIEDPRITFLDELGLYAVCYTAYARGGPRVALALTRDFVHFDRLGPVTPPEDKDAALLPRRIGGRWAMLHRPVSTVPTPSADIWMSFSDDLESWRAPTRVMAAREGAWWDAGKIGLSPPPVLVDQGWLMLYHGVRITPAGSLYRVGVALLDRDDPTRVLARGDEWVMGPYAAYEQTGDVPNVVFPCGVVPDGDDLHLYYGAADSSVCLATVSTAALLRHMGLTA